MVKIDRLNLIKERVEYLEKVKREGIKLKKRYEINELVYSPDHKRYGRILKDTKDFFAIDVNPEIVYIQRHENWSTNQIGFLKKNYRKMSTNELSVHLGLSRKEIESKMSSERLLRKRFDWTSKRDKFLLKSRCLTNKEIAKKLGTTEASVKGRLRRLRAMGKNIKPRKSFSRWTPDKDKVLLENSGLTHKIIAEKLSTSVSSIKGRLRVLREQGIIERKRNVVKKNTPTSPSLSTKK
jgi:biotin operon repressor